jgi:putative protease
MTQSLPEQRNQPELLAPAGNIESFFAALEHGADAIYVGCRHHNARALATNFSLEEIARLKEYAHEHQVKLYVALNAIARQDELGELVRILASLAQIEPDGLIIQDGAIARLCRHYFTNLDLHASTLMTVHNSAGVEQLQTMGFQRAVLARELSLDEITQICTNTSLELEIFVHGALCFSYSGLCLASSFYGGRSSLRGRCVQPCRRLYRSGRHQGHFLSTNDLSAIDLIPELRQQRLTSFKIEGRMKSESYVAAVVSAYRLVLDAAETDAAEAIAKARSILREAYGRKPTQGFLVADGLKELVTPHRSGASGRLAARVEWVRGKRMALRLQSPLAEGDRLRLDSDEEVEKTAFTIRNMVAHGKRLAEATAGTVVTVARIGNARSGDRLFKTASGQGKKSSAAKLRRLLRESTARPSITASSTTVAKEIQGKPTKRKVDSRPITIYLRFSDLRLVHTGLGSGAHWIILQATKKNLHSLQKRKLPPSKRDRIFLALPTIIYEKDLPFYRDQVSRLQQLGYNRWLVANWGHFQFFHSPPELLMADYTFNVINSQGSSLLQEMGCQFLILSMENDQDNLRQLAPAFQEITPLITVYGWPTLFTSRLQIKSHKNATIRTSGREPLQHTWEEGLTRVRSTRPLCLFERLQELRQLGVLGFVVDLRGRSLRPQELRPIMQGVERQRCPQPHSVFNYLAKLV